MKAQEPLIPTRLYKMVASMEAAIFSCQCDQMQNCEGAVVKPFIWSCVLQRAIHLATRRGKATNRQANGEDAEIDDVYRR